MNEIKIFENSQFGEIRTATTETGDPLFCLADLCKILDLNNVAMTKSRLNQDGVSTTEVIDSMGRIQKASFISESNLYKTIFQSRKPEAEEFTEWVTSDVLPAIRKHGAYMNDATIEKAITDPDFLIQLAQTLKEERRQKELAQKQLQYQAPIIKYANEVLSSTTGHTATVIGAELNMSAITLNELLCKANFIRKTGKKGEYSVCASYQGKGYVNVNTFKYVREDESVGSKIDIHFTEMGRMKIHEITNRAIVAGVLREAKGRYFINRAWKQAETA